MTDDDARRARLREALAALGERRLAAERERDDAMDATRPLIREARQLGIMPTELERLTALSRRSIYDVLGSIPSGGNASRAERTAEAMAVLIDNGQPCAGERYPVDQLAATQGLTADGAQEVVDRLVRSGHLVRQPDGAVVVRGRRGRTRKES